MIRMKSVSLLRSDFCFLKSILLLVIGFWFLFKQNSFMNNRHPNRGYFQPSMNQAAPRRPFSSHRKPALLLLLLSFLLIIADPSHLQAQDPHFTQFYAAPLFLNPAFAGSTGEGRATANYRQQWPGLDANFVTYAASYDQFFGKYRSGVGLLLKKDDQGANAGTPITSIDATALYSYHIPLNRIFALKAGLSFGYGMRSLNFNNFIFGDQLTPIPGRLNPTAEDLSANRKGFFDIGTGAVLFSENMWLRFSAAHLNKPNLSFLDGKDPLPRKFSIHGGYTFSINIYKFGKRSRARQNERSITPTFMYIQQGSSSQLSVGAYTVLEPLVVGFWYRGLPIKKTEAVGINQDAISMLTGFRLGNLSIGYSYDYTISRLSNLGSAGSHEISLTLHLKTGRHKSRGGRPFGYPQVLCPNPWKSREKLKYEHVK